tara:strand:+ start:805 stop:1185 length:381 start_codon:yes stop_codon:yes gene_type:complete
MLTLLNRLFPHEISLLIVKININYHINTYFIGKLYLLENIINDFNISINNANYYNLDMKFTNLESIYKLLNKIYNNYLKFNYYTFNLTTKNIISEYKNKLLLHANYQKPFMQPYLTKYNNLLNFII